MRIASLSLSLLFAACEAETKVGFDSGPLGSDSGDTRAGDEADTDTDSDADTDTDADGDADTDTDTDADADTAAAQHGLVGRTYVVDLSSANIVSPPRVGALLAAYLTQPILLGVESSTETELEMIGALGIEDVSPPEQDFCLATIDFPTADFTGNPDFAIGPTDISLAVAGSSIDVAGLEVSGTFAADGTYFDDGVVAGSVDTRPLDSLVGGSEGAICSLVATFGASCEPCSDGEEFCLSLRAEDVYAAEVEDMSITPVSGTNCEGCDDGPPAEDAECEA